MKSSLIEKDTLHLGDSLEVMEHIADKSCDMILCDLPYGVLHKNNPNAKWDNIIPFEPLWKQYERIIKDNGAIVLFAQGMFTARLMMSNPGMWRYNLIWDKMRVTGFLNANRMPMRCHEDICVFYKSLPTYNPQMTTGEPNHSRGDGTHKQTNNCYGRYKTGKLYDYHNGIRKVAPTKPGQKYPKSIIPISKEHKRGEFYHATQKPVNLLRWLIRTYSNVGDLVLDNCMGSGSTIIAAIQERRHYIGIEIDERFYGVARKRIESELRQKRMELW